jgi:hypothetical protein
VRGGPGSSVMSCGHGEVRGKEEAAERPHHHMELLEYSFVGEEQWTGGAASSRGASMAAAERALGARVLCAKAADECWGC